MIKGVDGCNLHPHCLTCPFDDCVDGEKPVPTEDQKQKWKEYYHKNKERISRQRKERRYKDYQKKYREEHPEMQYNANKKWAEEHREHKNELQRQYRERKKQQKVVNA